MSVRKLTDKDLREMEGLSEPAVKEAAVSPGLPPSSDSVYAGDYEDAEGPLGSEWTTLEGYANRGPGFIVGLYNKHFRDGAQKMYDWQIEQLKEIGDSFATATLHKPYRLALCAANGSGKDYLIVAPTVVFASITNIRCLTIITSSSGTQLTSQTENYIKSLCEAINEYHQQPIFRIRQRYIKCNLSGSEIRLFATDEAGKAEGYHPLEPDAKMLIVVNEAKSVSEDIFGALRRCTGFTHWLNVSTPGEPSGSFYRACTKPALGYRFRRVTCYDCPNHLSEEGRLADAEELGVNSALYRSKHLALFTSNDSDSLIPLEVVEKLYPKKIPVMHQNWPLRVGGDIAAGGDENAIVATRGNMIVMDEGMREKDTTITAEWFENKFIQLGLSKDHEHIYMDDGGIGHAVIDMLVRKGWQIRRIRNETKPIKPTHYGNRGAELWYAVARLCEELVLNLDNASQKLLEQLPSRHYKKSGTGGRIFLESKKEAKAEGRPSPDRADALILSFTGLSLDDFLVTEKTDDEDKPKYRNLTQAEILEEYENSAYDGEQTTVTNKRKVYGSLATATGNYSRN